MITIKSDKLKVGNKLTCINQYKFIFMPGGRYTIDEITDDKIKMKWNDRTNFPVIFPLDKEDKNSVFEYFKIW